MVFSLLFCAGQAACCACSTLNCICCTLPWGKKMATKAMYTGGLLLTIILAWAFNQWSGQVLKFALTDTCGAACFQYFSTFKIALASCIYHALLSVLLIRAESPGDVRQWLHKGLWPPKVIIWLAIFVGCFFIANSAMQGFWVGCAVFSIFFIIIQSILLVNFVANINEWLVDKYNETEGGFYKFCLIGITVVLNAFTIAGTIYFFIVYNDTPLHKTIISINLIMAVVQQILTVLPWIRESNPNASIMPSSCLSAYTTFLIGGALHDTTASGSSSENLGIGLKYLALALTFISMAYSAYSTGESSEKLTVAGKSEEAATETKSLGDEEDITDGDDYSYFFFHFIFFCASCYFALVITDWSQVTTDPVFGFTEDGYTAGWVKIATSWFVFALYIWILIAPKVFPDRDFS